MKPVWAVAITVVTAPVFGLVAAFLAFNFGVGVAGLFL